MVRQQPCAWAVHAHLQAKKAEQNLLVQLIGTSDNKTGLSIGMFTEYLSIGDRIKTVKSYCLAVFLLLL